MLIFSAISFPLTLLYQVTIAGASTEQWLYMKLIYLPLRFAGAYFLGCLIDQIRVRLSAQGNPVRRAIADALSLSLYQVPLYCLSAIIVGISWYAMAITSVLWILDNIFLGWLYGYILNQTRKYLYT